MNRQYTNVLWVILTLLVATTAYAGTAGYRLAGIVQLQQPALTFKALVELPNGEQKWFVAGDKAGEAVVREVAEQWIKLEFANEEQVLLRLAGSGYVTANSASQNTLMVVSREVNQQSLEQLKALSVMGATTAAAKFKVLLGIPEQATIGSMDEAYLDSTQAGIDRLINNLENGRFSRLKISGAPNLHEIYLMPPLNSADN